MLKMEGRREDRDCHICSPKVLTDYVESLYWRVVTVIYVLRKYLLTMLRVCIEGLYYTISSEF